MLFAVGAFLTVQRPIPVRRWADATPVRINDGIAPSFDGEEVWRTRTSRTYCVVQSNQVMEWSGTHVRFKSKWSTGPRGGVWIDTDVHGGNSEIIDPSLLLDLSDTRAVFADRNGARALVFERGWDLRWRRRE